MKMRICFTSRKVTYAFFPQKYTVSVYYYSLKVY